MVKLIKELFIFLLKEMLIKEVMELVEVMKEEFGIDFFVVVVVVVVFVVEVEEKKLIFLVIFKLDNGKKFVIVKVVKEFFNFVLMDVNKLVLIFFVILKENIFVVEVEVFKVKLVEVGVDVELK